MQTDLLLMLADKCSVYSLYFTFLFTFVRHFDNHDERYSDTMRVWVGIFMLDFTSTWFTFYSRLLAGNRSEVVQNKLEEIILLPVRTTLGFGIITLCEGLWLVLERIDMTVPESINKDLNLLKETQLFEFMLTILRSFGIYRTICNAIYLKQGFMRIIDLDVHERNAKASQN